MPPRLSSLYSRKGCCSPLERQPIRFIWHLNGEEAADDDRLMPTARTLCWHSGGHEARHANQKDTVMSDNTKLIGPKALRCSDPSGHPTVEAQLHGQGKERLKLLTTG